MSRRARGWVVEVAGARYGVLARSANAATKLAAPYCPHEALAARGPLPLPYVREMRRRKCVLVHLKSLTKEALTRGLALPRFRAHSSVRKFDQPTSKEHTMAKKAKQTKQTKQTQTSRADAKFKLNKQTDYAVREGTMSDAFITALPKGVFTKPQAVSATQKAVKSEERASVFFNYFKGKEVIVAA